MDAIIFIHVKSMSKSVLFGDIPAFYGVIICWFIFKKYFLNVDQNDSSDDVDNNHQFHCRYRVHMIPPHKRFFFLNKQIKTLSMLITECLRFTSNGLISLDKPNN